MSEFSLLNKSNYSSDFLGERRKVILPMVNLRFPEITFKVMKNMPKTNKVTPPLLNSYHLPGIAFAHFTAATTCLPPNILRVDIMRQVVSGIVLS